MIVVADTSVILNLCRVGHDHLLQALFSRVLIPTQVAAEFVRLSTARPRFSGLTLPTWIEQLPGPPALPPEVERAALDLGEASAIALCLVQHADALLIDESLGREVAVRLGLRTIGLLGVLVESRRRELIASVGSILARLEREAGFWIAPVLRSRVLRLAGESP